METTNPMNQSTPPDPSGPPTVQPSPVMGGQPQSRSHKTSWIALVVFVLIAAGVWYYYAYYYINVSQTEGPQGYSLPPRATVDDSSTLSLQQQGTSDEVGDIENDLNATDLNNLDRELSDIEAQFNP